MYREPLKCQIAVCSLEGASRLTGLDKGFWNVVSIHGPRQQKARLPHAKAIHYSCFDDIEVEASAVDRSPKPADIAGILNFMDALRPAPLMIHCEQGISRSTAVALVWIYRQLPPSDDRHLQSLDIVMELQPQAKPNRLVLTHGFAQMMDLSAARHLADVIISEPRVQRNYFRVW